MPNCTVLVCGAIGGAPPRIAHSFDTDGGVDVALKYVPRDLAPPRCRPVRAWDEHAVPRDTGSVVGHIEMGTPTTTHTLAYWEAASGIANEAGVMIAESTCSAIFRAEPAGHRGGRALLFYQELTRIALERCRTARDAVALMGALAVRHGFAGNVESTLTGSAETLAVVDGTEAWVMHVLPDDSGTSAVYCAQRVPDGHAACVANMFIVRNVDLEDARGARLNFMLSENATAIAERCGLWEGGGDIRDISDIGGNSTAFDFTRIFSAGEARHRYYSGRRQWRALSLFAPEGADLDCGPDPWYEEDLPGQYPFSVASTPARTSRDAFCRVMRDTYEGTPFDLSKQSAAGPFGVTDRFDAANGCKALDGKEDGAFERPIATFRMAYSYVGEPAASRGRDRGGQDQHMLWFAPHVSQTAVYLPVLISPPPPPATDEANAVPSALLCGTMKEIDRASAFWAFRIVKHTARGLFWNLCLPRIRERQQRWEARFLHFAKEQEQGRGIVDLRAGCDALSKQVVADWWKLNDELLLRFGDGWEYEWATDGTNHCRPVAYPRDWLQRNHFFRAGQKRGGEEDGVHDPGSPPPPPPPGTKLWTVEEKKKKKQKKNIEEEE